MNKILFILGTKPEAIKLSPVISECEKKYKIKVCLTSQHEKIKNILNLKNNKIIELNLNRDENGLSGLVGNVLCLLDKNKSIRSWKPDLIIVHGDTVSSLCGAFYAFYEKIKLCHVESGLRTHNKHSPFPEECNRKIIDYMADIHFAVNEIGKNNLIKENLDKIYTVGNTVIDVVKNNINCKFKHPILDWVKNENFAVVTLHRRENWGKNINNMLSEISNFSNKYKYKILYFTNNNNNIKNKVKKAFENNKLIYISDALDSYDFHNILSKCSFVMTDSGGLQEESCFLEKPILILRNETERIEILEKNCGILVPPNKLKKTLKNIMKLKFNKCKGLYGNGNSSKKITKILSKTK